MTPYIATDGNILTLSADFSVKQTPFNCYYYVKNATVQTDDYPYLIVRWKSTGPIATVAVAYTDSVSEKHEVVPYSSESENWTVTEV